MIVKRILVNNAGPFLSEWEIELPLGVTAVVGEYDDPPTASNRAGKSWIAVDAQLYALHGKFRGGADDLVHRLAREKEDGFVELALENSEGTDFVLRRGRTASGSPIRTLDGSPIKEVDLQRVVFEEILGLSYEEHLLTTAFVQGEMHAFMNMTPAEKRRIVSPWFRTDRWVPRHDLAVRRLSAAQSDLRRLDAREERAKELVAGADEADAELEVAVAAEEAARADLGDAMEGVAEAKAALAGESERIAEGRRLRAEVAEIEGELAKDRRLAEDAVAEREADLEAARRELAQATKRRNEIRALEAVVGSRSDRADAVAAVELEFATARSKHAEATRTREELLARHRRLTEDRTGTCPILGEPCDRVARDEDVVAGVVREGLRAKRAIARWGKAAKDLAWKLDMSRADLAEAEEAAERLAVLRGLPTKAAAVDREERAKRAAEDARSELDRVRTGRVPAARDLRRAQKALEALEGLDGTEGARALAAASERLEGARETVRDAERVSASARAAVAAVADARAELEDVRRRRKLARAEVERLAWTAYAFGSAGIPSRELENAFGVAEDAMNGVLGDLGAPTRLRFAPTRELKDWEPGCLACGFTYSKGTRNHVCSECGVPRRKKRRDELRLEVLDGEWESSFALDSGGGKVLLSLGARLGLATLPAAVRRVRCESAIIDEPDGALDPPNRAALHRLLVARLPDLGIRQALLITHADVRNEFDSVIVVKRWADEDRSGAWRD